MNLIQMKFLWTKYLFLVIVCCLWSCQDSKKETTPNPITIVFKNKLDIERKDAPVTLSKEDLLKKVDSLSVNEVVVLADTTGMIIPFQLDDSNNDGEWDEYNTTLHFEANEVKTLDLKVIREDQIPDFEQHTNIRFGIGKSKENVNEVASYERTGDPREKDSLFFQMEGPAWENDKVGFRIYFDPRNGIDIFGKTTAEMTLDKVGLKTNYHEIADWGMDVLKVGSSLGAGSIAIEKDGKLQRVSGTEHTKFTIVKEGPVKSTFELVFSNTILDKDTITITHRIDIWKGQWGYQSTVTASNESKNTNLVTGIVNLKPNTMQSLSESNFTAITTYGQQSENKDLLGMAVIAKQDSYSKQSNAPDDSKDENDVTKTYLVYLKNLSPKPTIFYFLTGWEKSDVSFSTPDGFATVVSNYMKELANPIEVIYE